MLRIRTLPNGLKVVFDHRPKEKRIALVIGIGRGSADEPEHLMGISHFLEHLIAARYPWSREITETVDRYGIESNASTSEDCTMFHFVAPSRNARWALDLLIDLVLVPEFSQEDVDHERGVIMEELKGDHDSVWDRLQRWLDQTMFASGHPLAQSVIGRPSTLRRMDYRILRAYWFRLLNPQHMAVTIVGNFDQAVMLAKIKSRLGELSVPGSPIALRTMRKPQKPRRRFVFREEGLSQAYFIWSFVLPGFGTKHRLPLAILTNCLAGRFSSSLFQDLRDRGLIYDVWSQSWFYAESGSLTIHCPVSRKNLMATLSQVRSTLDRYRNQGITRAEMDLAVRHLSAQTYMNFAQTLYAARFFTAQLLVHGRILPPQSFIRQLRAVKREDVQKTARHFLRPANCVFAALGPLTRRDKEKIRDLVSS